MNLSPSLFAVAVSSVLLSASASAATVVIVAPTSTTNGTVVFPADIHFQITGSSNSVYLFLSNYVTSDGTNTFSNPVVNDIMIAKNGGSPAAGGAIFFDNGADPMDPLTENSGFFYLTGAPSVMPGDIFTIKAGTITYGAVSNFNPQATQTFTGNMYLLAGDTTQIGVVVPEPAAGLFLAAAGSLFFRRRRSARWAGSGHSAHPSAG